MAAGCIQRLAVNLWLSLGKGRVLSSCPWPPLFPAQPQCPCFGRLPTGGSITATYGPYAATACTILSPTNAQCTTVAGVGFNLRWKFVINGNEVFSQRMYSLSYKPPSITAVSVGGGSVVFSSSVTCSTHTSFFPHCAATGRMNTDSTVPTTITISGTQFGDEPSLVEVRYGLTADTPVYNATVVAVQPSRIQCTQVCCGTTLAASHLPYMSFLVTGDRRR